MKDSKGRKMISTPQFKRMIQAARRSGECRLSRKTALLFLVFYANLIDELPVWFMVKGYDIDDPMEYVGLQTGDIDVDFLWEVAFGTQYTRFALWRIQ